jgi:hypothetical protein
MLAVVMAATVVTADAPSIKYTVPETLLVTTTALGLVPESINVEAIDTKGTTATVVVGATVVDEVVVDVVDVEDVIVAAAGALTAAAALVTAGAIVVLRMVLVTGTVVVGGLLHGM